MCLPNESKSLSFSLVQTSQLWMLLIAWNKTERGQKKQKSSTHFLFTLEGALITATEGTIIGIQSLDLFMSAEQPKKRQIEGGRWCRSLPLDWLILLFLSFCKRLANTWPQMGVIARFNTAIITEKWKTFISLCTSTWLNAIEAILKMWDLIKEWQGK